MFGHTWIYEKVALGSRGFKSGYTPEWGFSALPGPLKTWIISHSLISGNLYHWGQVLDTGRRVSKQRGLVPLEVADYGIRHLASCVRKKKKKNNFINISSYWGKGDSMLTWWWWWWPEYNESSNGWKKVKLSVSQSCLALCVPADCGIPGSSVHGLVQAGILEWVVIPFSRGSSWPRHWTRSPTLQEASLPSEPPGNDGGGGLNITEAVMVTHDPLLSWSHATIFCEPYMGHVIRFSQKSWKRSMIVPSLLL